jgi:hypothetical protein
MPPSLYPRERDPIPIPQEVGWASGLVWRGKENPVPTTDLTPDCPAHSMSLYQLHHPGCHIKYQMMQKCFKPNLKRKIKPLL